MFSPASCHSVISVLRFSAVILLRPATYWPSHLTLKRKLRYGSNRLVLAFIRAIAAPPLPSCTVQKPSDSRSALARCFLLGRLVDLLAQLQDDKLGGLEGCEANQDVDHA